MAKVFRFQGGDHLRRWNDDQLHVAVRVDAGGGHPVADFVVVGRDREHHGEGHWRAAIFFIGVDHLFQRARRERPLLHGGRVGPEHARVQIVRDSDAVAVQVHAERGDGGRGRRAEAEGGGDRHAGQHVRAVERAGREFVADVGPRGFFRYLAVETVFAEVAQLVRHHDRRAVGERNDAEGHVRLFRCFARAGVGGALHARRHQVDDARGRDAAGHAGLEKVAAR